MSPAPQVPPDQRELLRQALADAVSYRDPPVYCPACQAHGGALCEPCAATFARASGKLATFSMEGFGFAVHRPRQQS